MESPIGDFFAAGNGMRANVSSMPIEVTSYGRAFNSYWRMPFRRKARITMTNESDKPVSSCYYIDWLKFAKLPADALYFHARYRKEFPFKPFSPYEVAEIQGKGHYVGTVLSIQSSFGSWLGESDDRFYIDGEEVPLLVGTGLEDYFTDAWNMRLFTNLRAGVSPMISNIALTTFPPWLSGMPASRRRASGIFPRWTSESIRRSPWENRWEWMQNYLKREEQLFARRVEAARQMVQSLSAAVTRFRRDTGTHPLTLEELIFRPGRLTGNAGSWLYYQEARIPLDPWGQPYRYLQPGMHNREGFDLWSLHGNEREPGGWIGNWK